MEIDQKILANKKRILELRSELIILLGHSTKNHEDIVDLINSIIERKNLLHLP